jgi:phage shock protein PspC (stress-responsive transcriptional regulator)
VNPLDRTVRPSPAGFHLDRDGGKALGVCQGIANYTGIDPTIVRAVVVLGTLFGFGSFVLIYFVIALLAN